MSEGPYEIDKGTNWQGEWWCVRGPTSNHQFTSEYGEDWKGQAQSECNLLNKAFLAGQRAAEATFAERLRAARAEAWNEGCRYALPPAEDVPVQANPYIGKQGEK